MFDVVERKPLGGTLMTYLHDHLNYRLAGEHPYRLWTQVAVDLESALIDRGVLNSDYAFYVLSKRGATSPNAYTITENLKQRSDKPLWSLDSWGTMKEAWKGGPYEVSAQETFTIQGWAVDRLARSAAGGIEIVIDETVYAGHYGSRRGDVAKVHGEAAYVNSGYTFQLEGDRFALGPHKAFIRVISNDKQSFWQAGPYLMFVR